MCCLDLSDSFIYSNIVKMVLSSTNQTTPNHEGYPLVFHVLDFNLKHRNIIGDNDEKHKRAKTRPLSAQSNLSSKFFVRFAFIGYKRQNFVWKCGCRVALNWEA